MKKKRSQEELQKELNNISAGIEIGEKILNFAEKKKEEGHLGEILAETDLLRRLSSLENEPSWVSRNIINIFKEIPAGLKRKLQKKLQKRSDLIQKAEEILNFAKEMQQNGYLSKILTGTDFVKRSTSFEDDFYHNPSYMMNMLKEMMTKLRQKSGERLQEELQEELQGELNNISANIKIAEKILNFAKKMRQNGHLSEILAGTDFLQKLSSLENNPSSNLHKKIDILKQISDQLLLTESVENNSSLYRSGKRF